MQNKIHLNDFRNRGQGLANMDDPWSIFKMQSKLSPPPSKRDKRENFFHGLLSFPSLSSENELLEEVSSPILFWIPLQDIQCEKFIWNESVSLLVYASWYCNKPERAM